jgi:hypothetical protein
VRLQCDGRAGDRRHLGIHDSSANGSKDLRMPDVDIVRSKTTRSKPFLKDIDNLRYDCKCC